MEHLKDKNMYLLPIQKIFRFLRFLYLVFLPLLWQDCVEMTGSEVEERRGGGRGERERALNCVVQCSVILCCRPGSGEEKSNTKEKRGVRGNKVSSCVREDLTLSLSSKPHWKLCLSVWKQWKGVTEPQRRHTHLLFHSTTTTQQLQLTGGNEILLCNEAWQTSLHCVNLI